MKVIFLLATALFSLSAHATKYNCVTAAEVPGKFYEYETDPTELSLYEMKDSKASAAEYLAHQNPETPFDKAKVKLVKEYKKSEFGGGHIFWIRPGTKDLLYIPYLTPGFGDDEAVLTTKGMAFDGVPVSKVTYTLCGDD